MHAVDGLVSLYLIVTVTVDWMSMAKRLYSLMHVSKHQQRIQSTFCVTLYSVLINYVNHHFNLDVSSVIRLYIIFCFACVTV